MSFSSEIKNKLCGVKLECAGCVAAELAGLIRFSGSVTEERIKFTTENPAIAERVEHNLYEGFGLKKCMTHKESTRAYTFLTEDINEIENISSVINSEDCMPFECCRASYVRGVFLGGGSVNNPQKNYHLEFGTKTESEAEFLMKILEEHGFGAKLIERKGRMIVYIKEFEKIADLLGYIGAGKGALEMFSVQIEKQVRNDINRRVNCENANTDKMTKASSKHTYAIKKIKQAGVWDKLPDVLKEIGQLRVDNPEMSLKELGENTVPPIGKSGVNHRLSRIIEIADEL